MRQTGRYRDVDVLTSCLDCGEQCAKPSRGGARCRGCLRKKESSNGVAERRKAYDSYSWKKFSRSMRSGPVCCSVCGTTEDLTTDHSPEAWDREAKKLPRRTSDYDVKCRVHNSEAGAARPAWSARRNQEVGNS